MPIQQVCMKSCEACQNILKFLKFIQKTMLVNNNKERFSMGKKPNALNTHRRICDHSCSSAYAFKNHMCKGLTIAPTKL